MLRKGGVSKCPSFLKQVLILSWEQFLYSSFVWFCHCTEEGTWIGAKTFAFIESILASVIKYTKKIEWILPATQDYLQSLPCHLAVNVGVSLTLSPLLLLWAVVWVLHPPAVHLGGGEGVVVLICRVCVRVCECGRVWVSSQVICTQYVYEWNKSMSHDHERFFLNACKSTTQ